MRVCVPLSRSTNQDRPVARPNGEQRPRRATTRLAILCLVSLLAALDACRDAGPSVAAPTDARVLWWAPDHVGDGLPSVDGTQVYFTTQPHRVLAVSKSTGRIAWSRDLPVDRPGFFGEGSRARGGRVFVADEDVFALDDRTGALLWRFRPEGSRNTGVFLPAFDGDRLITGSSNGHVFAISQSTGEEIWRSKVVRPDTVTMYRPQVGDGVVAVGFTDYVTAGGNVARGGVAVLDRLDGHVRWLRYLPAAIDSAIANGVISPVIVAGAVVIGAWDGPVYAFELTTGALRWTSPGVGIGDQIRGLRPLATDGVRLFVGSSAGVVLALDPQTGDRIWSAPPTYGSTNELLPFAGRLYWSYSGGQFEVRDAATGDRLWVHDKDPLAFSGPVDDGARVYVSGVRGVAALAR